MKDKLMEEKIENLVDYELNQAVEKFGPFHGPHEAWSVMHEEYQETKAEIRNVKKLHKNLWIKIKKGQRKEQLVFAEEAYKTGLELINEAIQYTAMAKRYLQDIKK